MKPGIMQTLFDRAAEEELGLVIETNNPSRMQDDLVIYKKDLPNADQFIVARSSNENTVIIVKKTVELDNI